MPVLLNTNTQLAEDLPQEGMDAALAKGTHEVPLYSPDGTLGSAPASEASKLLAEGYTQPSPDQLGHLMREAKYSSPEEQLKATGHGILKGLLPFGIGTGLERLAGRSPEDMRGEEEFNPGITTGSELGSFALSSLIPVAGQAKVLGTLGKAAGALNEGRIASRAISGATELALLQAGNESSKMLMNDPHQSFQSAVANVGLAGFLGGAGGVAVGSAHPLWEKTLGPKAEQFIQDAQDRFGDLRRTTSNPEEYLPLGKADTGGGKFVDWLVNKATGDLSGAAIGRTAGHSTGIPGMGALGAVLGGKYVSPMLEPIIDAIKKPLIEGAANSSALKSAIDYGLNVIKGDNLTGKAVKALFTNGTQVTALIPLNTQKDTDHVENWLKVAQQDPETLINSQQHDMGHYLPGHNEAAGETVARALGHLAQARPNYTQNAPLDGKPTPDPVSQGAYEQTRALVMQPMGIISKIQDGTINPSMVNTIKTVYPAYYQGLTQKMMGQVVDLTHKGQPIPYKLRLGLSAFLGQPLDSSIMPHSIMVNQMSPSSAQQTMRAPQGHSSTKNLSKLPGMYATPMQANEQENK